jgi:hypothetical protein
MPFLFFFSKRFQLNSRFFVSSFVFIFFIFLNLIAQTQSLLKPFKANAEFGGAYVKYGYKDATGKVVIEPSYYSAGEFSEGLAAVSVLTGETVTSGNWIKYGYIDETGKEIISLQFQGAERFREGLAAVKLKNKWGFINKSGKVIITPEYDYVHDFSEGLAVVNKGYMVLMDEIINYGQCGYINKSGKMVIPLNFKEAYSFKDGKAIVYSLFANRQYKIDKTGKEVKE